MGETESIESIEEVVSRRHLLLRSLGGAAAAGLGAAVVSEVLNPSPATASSATFDSATGVSAVRAENTGPGIGVEAVAGGGTSTQPALYARHFTDGNAVRAEIAAPNGAPAGPAAAIYGTTAGGGAGVQGVAGGAGAGVMGVASGTGNGVHAEVNNAASAADAAHVFTNGTGRALFAHIFNAANAAAAVHGFTTGTGHAVYGNILNTANPKAAVNGETAGSGPAVRGFTNGTGYGVLGQVFNPASTFPAVHATHNGAGPSIYAFTNGTSRAVLAQISNANNSSAAIDAFTDGTGVAARLEGGRAQLRLVAATSTGPGATFHDLGEVFLGDQGDLMLCKKEGDPGTFLRVGYNALAAPFRLVDTRLGIGGGIFGPEERREITVAPSGVAPNNVPGDSAIHAIVLNVTVVDGTAPGYLTVLPADADVIPPGGDAPFSNVNWVPGQVQANQATVRVTFRGVVGVFNRLGNVHVIIDVMGFFS